MEIMQFATWTLPKVAWGSQGAQSALSSRLPATWISWAI